LALTVKRVQDKYIHTGEGMVLDTLYNRPSRKSERCGESPVQL